ncbi:MAG: DUF3419 family protein [Myxococcota bacterium]
MSVQLHELLFTMSWEDPELDRGAWRGGVAGRRIATVASGGCNTFAFLLDDPAEVFAFDYNPTQVHLCALKQSALRTLDDAELYELLGVRPSDRRAALLARLPLGDDTRRWVDAQPWLVSDGVTNGGRYERFVGLFRRVLPLVQGRKVRELFEPRDAAGRAAFYDQRWDSWRWRMLFRLFFNKTMLARRGLQADYFTFDDGRTSFADDFRERAARALRDLDVRDNPFVAQYTLGRYLDEAHLPAWLRPENLPTVRARVDRVTFTTGDARDVWDRFDPGAFAGICLSNVCELMSVDDTARVFVGVARALAPGGVATLRNLMVPRSAPPMPELSLDVEGSAELAGVDRSFVYRSFQRYVRREP